MGDDSPTTSPGSGMGDASKPSPGYSVPPERLKAIASEILLTKRQHYARERRRSLVFRIAFLLIVMVPMVVVSSWMGFWRSTPSDRARLLVTGEGGFKMTIPLSFKSMAVGEADTIRKLFGDELVMLLDLKKRRVRTTTNLKGLVLEGTMSPLGSGSTKNVFALCLEARGENGLAAVRIAGSVILLLRDPPPRNPHVRQPIEVIAAEMSFPVEVRLTAKALTQSEPIQVRLNHGDQSEITFLDLHPIDADLSLGVRISDVLARLKEIGCPIPPVALIGMQSVSNSIVIPQVCIALSPIQLTHYQELFTDEFQEVLSFSVAHELAHWLLDEGRVSPLESERGPGAEGASRLEEIQADLIAANLLAKTKLLAAMRKDVSISSKLDTNLWARFVRELDAAGHPSRIAASHPPGEHRILAAGYGFMAGIRYFCSEQVIIHPGWAPILRPLVEKYERQVQHKHLLPKGIGLESAESLLHWSKRAAQIIENSEPTSLDLKIPLTVGPN